MLKISTFILGMVQTNVYLIADSETGDTVIIDPAWDGQDILDTAQKQKWKINQIWITHAHFDHFAGVDFVANSSFPAIPVCLHPDDLDLWREGGGAHIFNIDIKRASDPNIHLRDREILSVGKYFFEVRHIPGHSSGHVVFYCSEEKLMFCGDVIFRGSIGRTDLPGGNFDTLINGIQKHILTLSDDVLLLPGHGSETSVGRERKSNPYLNH